MAGIKAKIERFTDESNPGWVACNFADAAGLTHPFEEKVPIVSAEDLDAKSEYPREVVIGCTVISSRVSADGRELVLIDTELPCGIESKAGQVRFEVLREQLELDDGAG